MELMNDHVTLFIAVIAVQLYSAFDEIRSLLVDEELAVHLQTLSTNAIGVCSTLLTVVHNVRLRRIRCTLDRVERSLQGTATVADDRINGHSGTVPWTCGYHAKAWLALAVAAYGYLKYCQLTVSGKSAYVTAAVTLLRTVSMAGHYYVTVMYVCHVFLVKRVLCKLNVRITNSLGSVSALPTATGGRFTVSAARLAYLDVRESCATVTGAFQTQLFINIVGNVFGVTFMMLSAFNALMSDGTDDVCTILYFLYDSLIRTVQIYFIIDACHTTVEQANIINITFQKKINEFHHINTTKRKIQLFILEMLDHKIEFIIYGFICLNFEMFVSIMGTVATYLLILVQLGSTPDIIEKTANATNVTTARTNNLAR